MSLAFAMRMARSKTAAGLVLFSVLAIAWVGSIRIGRDDRATLGTLLGDLRAEVPWYYRWMERRSIHQFLPKKWLTKAIQTDMKIDMRRRGAESKLIGMGTNAWPAVPHLVKALAHENRSVGVAAGGALAGIKAEEHPDWASLAKGLDGQIRPAQVFRYIFSGRDQFARRYDFTHRRFGLIGLAAVGPAAPGTAIPEVEEVLKSKEDHELWVLATVALHRIGGQMREVVSFQKRVLQDTEEWPNVRASAAKVLAAAVPEDPETRNLLRQSLQDEKALVRLTAAQQLWKLNALPEEVLPTLAALLKHKLLSIRTAALNTVAEIEDSNRTSSAAGSRR